MKILTDTGLMVLWNKIKQLVLGNRQYNPSEFSGKGYKVLEKNIQTVGGVKKNILTSVMINQPNTIYEIRYDFNLGEDITIPNNCVLKFDGGSISGNGANKNTITGNNTCIISNANSIFKDIIFAGSFKQDFLYVDWFNYSSDSDKIQNAIVATRTINAIVLFSGRTYTIDKTITLDDALDQLLYLKGISNKTTLSCSLNIPVFSGGNAFERIEDVTFTGNARGVGSYAFLTEAGYNGSIKHCYFYNFDIALHVGFVELNIEDCYFSDNNIGIVPCKRTNLTTCLNIESCIFVGNKISGIKDNLYPDETESTTGNNIGACKKVKISDSIFEKNNQAFEIRFALGKLIYNCWFERNSTASKIVDYSVIKYNNVFDSEPDWTNFDIPANSYGYGFGGSISLNGLDVRARAFELSCYDDNYKAIDNGQNRIYERIINSKHYPVIVNNNTKKIGVINSSDTDASNNGRIVAHRIYLYVKSDGTLAFNTNTSMVTSVSYDDTNKVYTITLPGKVYSPSIVVTPNNSTQFLTYYLDRGDNTEWAYGMSYDVSNHIKVKFKDESGNAVAANFGMLIDYSL